VAIAPPDAEDAADRLRDSFMSDLQATCEPSEAEVRNAKPANPN